MSTTLKKQTALQPGERVLVTGANSYLASHMIDLLLSLGYLVRGTVRAEKPWLDEYFSSKYGAGKFESVVVPDVTHKESLLKVLGDISGVLHVASDLSFSADADKVINGVIKATQSVLEAAAEQKSIKRFILTSSSTAATQSKPNVEGIVVDENSWNEEIVKLARAETPDPGAVYGASKMEGERFAFKWVKEHNPQFTFNTVIPNFCMGPFLSPDFNGSFGKYVVDLLRGSTAALVASPQYYVNVKDVARLHVIALLDPEIKSDRLFAFAGTYNWTQIIGILHKLRPDNDKLPTPPENEGRDLSVIKPRKRAEELLKSWFDRPGWVSLEQTLKESVETAGL